MKVLLILGFAAMLAGSGCKQEAPPPNPISQPKDSNGVFPGQSTGREARSVTEWVKVKVNGSGEIYLNKKLITLEEFSAECARLKKVDGAVTVFIETTNRILSVAQSEAMHRIIDAGVPMKMALKESDLD